MKWCLFVLFSITTCSLTKEVSLDKIAVPKVSSVTFLINVNNSYQWIPPFDNSSYACIVTVKTDHISPNTPVNKTGNTMLGNCDNGSLVFTINSKDKGNSSAVLTFHSTFLAPTSPPTCTIDWNYSYRLPTQTMGPGSMDDAGESLLPGCFISWSGGPENIQTVSYWFYILDWDLTSRGYTNPKHHDPSKKPPSVVSVTFLVAVNQTETKCLMTSKTAPLRPGVLHNQTEYIHVGNCDYGALDFNITTSIDVKGKNHSYIDLVFHSHDIEDASPPTCKILWDYSYKVPSEENFRSSLLPGCYTAESREGFHMTYYWFYVLDWTFG